MVGMMSCITDQELIQVTETVRERVMLESGAELWPDCYRTSDEVVNALDKLLFEKDCYDVVSRTIAEYVINGEYKHYVVEVCDSKTGGTKVIDSTFTQFAYETDTPLGVATLDEIADVVVVPMEEYVFFEWKTNNIPL